MSARSPNTHLTLADLPEDLRGEGERLRAEYFALLSAGGFLNAAGAVDLALLTDLETVRGADLETLRAIAKKADALAELGGRADMRDARVTLAEAKETASTIADETERVNALTAIAAMELRTGLDASETIASINEVVGTSNTPFFAAKSLGPVAKVQAAAGYLLQAQATAAVMEEGGFRDGAFAEIAVAAARQGRFLEASDAVELIPAALSSRIDYRAIALAGIATAQADAGLIHDAKATMNGIVLVNGLVTDTSHPKALAAIAIAEQAAGHDADETFALAKESASKLSADTDASEARRMIALAEFKVGRYAAAERTISDITIVGIRTKALAELATLEMHMGIDASIKLAAAATLAVMSRNSYYDTALRALAAAQAQAGLLPLAKQTAARIPAKLDKVGAFEVIALVEAHAGSFTEAKETAAMVVSPAHRCLILSKIAIAQAQAGHYAQAKETALQANTSRDDAHIGIATAQAQAGLYAQAKQTAVAIGSSEAKVRALAAIAELQATRPPKT